MGIEPRLSGLESDALASRLPTASEVECVIIQLLFAGPFLNLSCVVRVSSTTTEDRLNGLTTIAIEHELAEEINVKEFIKKFSELKGGETASAGPAVGVVRVRIDILFLLGTVTVSDNRRQWRSDHFMREINL
ncbi:hypothetical protein TNCV_5074321 [Trichonephila clavipes]|nr:hypothetical protein TNCV_5074321 [Trichonephila clavipes]